MEKITKPDKYIGNELIYIKKVLDSEHRSATSGNWTNLLEQEFAKKFKAKYAVALNSGTSGLHACLSAAGVGPGDEVIVPPLPVIMDCFAAIYMNAVPIFADVDPDTFNIDPKSIEKRITPKTKAIITVSTYGLSPDMDPIMELAKKHNLVVIEDNCQNYLGLYKGRLAGTIGDMAVYSLENSKHMSSGEGGMVITNSEHFAERVRKCGGIGYKQLKAEEGRIKLDEGLFQDPDYKRFDSLGWNYRMTEFCAAVGLAQLERLDELVEKRRQIAQFYEEAVSGCSWMIPQKTPEGSTNAYFTYGLKYEGEEAVGVTWKEFYNTYKEMGGDGFYGSCIVAYLEPVIYEGNYYGKGSHYTGPRFKYEKGYCPIAESVQPKLMQFKTNYRDLKLAKEKTEVLKKTIDKVAR